MKRIHEMPFGARYGAGGTRFRLWAPACDAVTLELGRENPRRVAMQRDAEGFHEASVADVAPGSAYAYRVNADGPAVPDPASRSNPWDANAPSAVVDPAAFEWTDDAWRGRPWNEAVVYELHVGTFTPEGTFAAVIGKLDYLVSLGVTAIELMPLADFPGQRNWGYDGVLPFAPDSAYGSPEDLKRLVCAAHERGLMVLLDVVYNHFGPDGNYLHSYAPQFFNEAHKTPWGAAINFDGPHNAPVRAFFRHNALYWIEEFHLDGLRLDAVHAIADDTGKHIVTEVAEAIAAGPGRERHVHLVLENDANDAHLLERGSPNGTAQWNDDSHHAAHVLATGEIDGYYVDYAERPGWQLGRTFAEGFAYQGDASKLRKGEKRGQPSRHLPHEAFINFIQNHDQVGNRALGERIGQLAPERALRLLAAAYLLAPTIPMIFMGEEFGAATPFLFFCDFHGELADAVREGRRREFAAFAKFADPAVREKIPDPNAPETFAASRLDWACLERDPHAARLRHYRELLALRHLKVVPRLDGHARAASFRDVGREGVEVDWVFGDGTRLNFRGNFSESPRDGYTPVPGATLLHAENGAIPGAPLPAWGGLWMIATP